MKAKLRPKQKVISPTKLSEASFMGQMKLDNQLISFSHSEYCQALNSLANIFTRANDCRRWPLLLSSCHTSTTTLRCNKALSAENLLLRCFAFCGVPSLWKWLLLHIWKRLQMLVHRVCCKAPFLSQVFRGLEEMITKLKVRRPDRCP